MQAAGAASVAAARAPAGVRGLGRADGPRGSWPLGTARQVPAEPETLQAKQVSVQALPQQTPSTQNPVVHMARAAAGNPAASLAAQRPASQ